MTEEESKSFFESQAAPTPVVHVDDKPDEIDDADDLVSNYHVCDMPGATLASARNQDICHYRRMPSKKCPLRYFSTYITLIEHSPHNTITDLSLLSTVGDDVTP